MIAVSPMIRPKPSTRRWRPRAAGRQQDAAGGCGLGLPDGEGGFPHVLRDRLQALPRGAHDKRQRDQREHEPGREERAAEDDAPDVRLRKPRACWRRSAVPKSARTIDGSRRSSRRRLHEPRERDWAAELAQPDGDCDADRQGDGHRRSRRRGGSPAAGRGGRRSRLGEARCGRVQSRSGRRYLIPWTRKYTTIAAAIAQNRMPSEPAEPRPSRSERRQAPARLRGAGVGGGGPPDVVGGAHVQTPPVRLIDCLAAQPVRESIAAEKSRTDANANSVCLRRRRGQLVDVGDDRRRQRPRGSTRKISPSKGLGEKPTPPETIASMIASPIARAVAITVPATRAGRAVRTAIIQKVRQRLMPSASDPSSQLLGHRVQAVGEDRDHERGDHHREDQHRRRQAVAVQLR